MSVHDQVFQDFKGKTLRLLTGTTYFQNFIVYCFLTVSFVESHRETLKLLPYLLKPSSMKTYFTLNYLILWGLDLFWVPAKLKGVAAKKNHYILIVLEKRNLSINSWILKILKAQDLHQRLLVSAMPKKYLSTKF